MGLTELHDCDFIDTCICMNKWDSLWSRISYDYAILMLLLDNDETGHKMGMANSQSIIITVRLQELLCMENNKKP